MKYCMKGTVEGCDLSDLLVTGVKVMRVMTSIHRTQTATMLLLAANMKSTLSGVAGTTDLQRWRDRARP